MSGEVKEAGKLSLVKLGVKFFKASKKEMVFPLPQVFPSYPLLVIFNACRFFIPTDKQESAWGGKVECDGGGGGGGGDGGGDGGGGDGDGGDGGGDEKSCFGGKLGRTIVQFAVVCKPRRIRPWPQ